MDWQQHKRRHPLIDSMPANTAGRLSPRHPGTVQNRFTGAQTQTLGLVQFWIPKYAGMTAGEPYRTTGMQRPKQCSSGKGGATESEPGLFCKTPGVGTSPSVAPVQSAVREISRDLAMRSAILAPNVALNPDKGPGNSHGHGSTAEKTQASHR